MDTTSARSFLSALVTCQILRSINLTTQTTTTLEVACLFLIGPTTSRFTDLHCLQNCSHGLTKSQGRFCLYITEHGYSPKMGTVQLPFLRATYDFLFFSFFTPALDHRNGNLACGPTMPILSKYYFYFPNFLILSQTFTIFWRFIGQLRHTMLCHIITLQIL